MRDAQLAVSTEARGFACLKANVLMSGDAQANTLKNVSSDLFSFRDYNDLRSWHRPKSPFLKSARGKIVRW